jgi:aminoglycoside phosphotransferase (APT) family kinase protein
MSQGDEARDIRTGEELNVDQLGVYLREQLGGVGELTIKQFRGGHSNLTYLLDLGGQEYVLRRPPFGSRVKTAHDMGREYRVLTAVRQVWDKVPEPVLHCQDEEVIGAPFYLMKRVRGLIVRTELPGKLGPESASKLCESFVDTLAQLHDLDYDEIGLGDFGKPEGYVRRQVEGWTKRYAAARTDDVPDMDRVSEHLAEHLIGIDDDDALIHNDFKLDNLVLDPDDPTRIIGILDWEMSTIGHPMLDLGTTLGYWVDADDPPPMKMLPFGPTHAPGMLSRRQLVERYQAYAHMPVQSPELFYAFGLWKTAVVAQQIYFRYKQGHTSDPRFEQMLMGVRVLSAQAAAALGL